MPEKSNQSRPKDQTDVDSLLFHRRSNEVEESATTAERSDACGAEILAMVPRRSEVGKLLEESSMSAGGLCDPWMNRDFFLSL